jgi:ribosomal protein S18 acetylase RimI-like enzyme
MRTDELWDLAVTEILGTVAGSHDRFGGRLVELPGASGVVGSEIPIPCWVHDRDADLRGVLDALAAGGEPGPVHIVDDHPDQALLLRAGWELDERVTEMVLLERPATGPHTVRVERVAVPDGVDALYAAMARGFEVSPEEPEAWLPRQATEVEGVQLFLARGPDGEAIGTAGLRRRVRGAGLFAISVPPEHRGRGIGEALTRHAAQAAFDHGAELVQLQASPDGYGVYARVGFQPAGRWAFYRRSP